MPLSTGGLWVRSERRFVTPPGTFIALDFRDSNPTIFRNFANYPAPAPTMVGSFARVRNGIVFDASSWLEYNWQFSNGTTITFGDVNAWFIVCVTVANAQHGALIKIGSDANGVGFGIGGNDFDTTASPPNVRGLVENVQWVAPAGAAIPLTPQTVLSYAHARDGSNVARFYFGINGVTFVTPAVPGPVSASPRVRIGGYATRTIVGTVIHWLMLGMKLPNVAFPEGLPQEFNSPNPWPETLLD